MLGDEAVQDGTMGGQGFHGPDLILTHQTGVALHVGREDCSKAALHSLWASQGPCELVPIMTLMPYVEKGRGECCCPSGLLALHHPRNRLRIERLARARNVPQLLERSGDIPQR